LAEREEFKRRGRNLKGGGGIKRGGSKTKRD